MLDVAGVRAVRSSSRALDAAADHLVGPARAVGDRARRATARAERELDGTAARVRAHDPQLALARGWSITTTAEGRLVRHLADAPPGTTLVTRVADGQVTSTVTDPPARPRSAGARTMSTPTPVDELSYTDALAELEAILERLEHDEPDVDRVADDVARATALIEHCRTRITAARIKVDQVVAGLTPEPAEPADEGDEPDPAT